MHKFKVHKRSILLIPVLPVKYETASKEPAIIFKGVMFSFLKYITDFMSRLI